jgi:hypothetical protein
MRLQFSLRNEYCTWVILIDITFDVVHFGLYTSRTVPKYYAFKRHFGNNASLIQVFGFNNCNSFKF